MCASQNVTLTTVTSTVSSNSQKNSSKPVPKWMKMKQQNKSSAGKTAKPTAQKSSSSAQQKPNQGTRNEKRARWAKKAKPLAKPAAKVFRGPVYEYISACCSLPAQKPSAGAKEAVKDPESGKTKDKSKGLGHWRCSGCRKVCKVSPRKPEAKKADAIPGSMLQPTIGVPVETTTA